MSQTAPLVGQQKRQYFIGRVAEGNPRGHVAIILIFLHTCCKTSLWWGTSQYFIGRVAIPIACSILLCFTIPARDDIIYYMCIYIYIYMFMCCHGLLHMYIYIYIYMHTHKFIRRRPQTCVLHICYLTWWGTITITVFVCICCNWDGGKAL